MFKKMNPDLMLVFVAVIWGTGFIATEYAIDANMPASMILAYRFAVAALTLLGFVAKDLRKVTKKQWISGIIAGCLLFLGFFFQTFGQSMTTVSNSAFLTAVNVVLVPFIVWVISKHRPQTKIFFTALLTFVGIVVLTVDTSAGFSLKLGDLYVLICAVMFAGHISYLGIAAKGGNPLVMTFIQMAVASVLSLIVLWIVGGSQGATVDYVLGLPSVVYLGLFSTCLCFFLQTSAQQRTSAGKAGIIMSMESLFGTLFSVVLGIEPLTLKIVIGGLIIFTAVTLTEVDLSFGRRLQKNRA